MTCNKEEKRRHDEVKERGRDSYGYPNKLPNNDDRRDSGYYPDKEYEYNWGEYDDC